MYAQTTKIRVPANKMADLRRMIEQDYLPVVSHRPGFIAAYLLEQVDDENFAEMIQFWDTHSAAENFTRTGLLASSIQSLAATIPGVQIQRQGYIVRVAVDSQPAYAGVGASQ
jgi:hypothetical protein